MWAPFRRNPMFASAFPKISLFQDPHHPHRTLAAALHDDTFLGYIHEWTQGCLLKLTLFPTGLYNNFA